MASKIRGQAVFIDYRTDYCQGSSQLLNSSLFSKVLKAYLHFLMTNQDTWWREFAEQFPQKEDEYVKEFTNIFKLFLNFQYNEIQHPYLQKRKHLELFVEYFYDYWRKLERYSLLLKPQAEASMDETTFLDSETAFSSLVMKTYRKISRTIMGEGYKVYRQLTAGRNLGVIAANMSLPLPPAYAFLNQVKVITTLILHIPFIVYPKSTTREGQFKEVDASLLSQIKIKDTQWYCFPIMVGDLLALVYASDEYMNILVSLGNLFAPAKEGMYQKRKPDLIYIYGEESSSLKEPSFFYDQTTDIYVGVAPKSEAITYFGYLKKMLLTLHNLKRIHQGYLPIQGAMASLIFKDGMRKNIVLVGDSGAGKSETLEAIRLLSGKRLARLKIIFDDMGYLKISGNRILGYGSEIGAFVRVDDLDSGYAYEHMDRAIFMNPNKQNARLLIPVSAYQDIIKGEVVDAIFYANNYSDKQGFVFFNQVEAAQKVYIEGKRMAKKTTDEQGLVTSFFSNPFGMVQWKEKSQMVIERYFQQFFESDLPVGELYTRLGIDEGLHGPLKAAKALLAWLKKEE